MKDLHPPQSGGKTQVMSAAKSKPAAARSAILREPVRITIRRDVWRLTYEQYDGRKKVSLRKWYFDTAGELCATRAGLTLTESELRELGAACLSLAAEIANDNA